MDQDIEKNPTTNTSGPASISSSSQLAPRPIDKSRCDFAWENISYTVDTPNGKKPILQNISGYAEKGDPNRKCAYIW